MACVSPVTLIKTTDEGGKYKVTVPCGKCIECLKSRRNEWSFRLNQELSCAKSAHFVTLTYNEETCPRNDLGWPTLSKKDVQKFLKRLRKHTKTRYYIVGEYGSETFRAHYHGIFFNLPEFIRMVVDGEKKVVTTADLLLRTWGNGHIMVGDVNPKSINYVTKYVFKKKDEEYDNKELEKPFSLISLRPAIGANYLQSSGSYHIGTRRFYGILPGGTKVNLPRYYKTKLFGIKTIQQNAEEKITLADKVRNEAFARITSRGENFFFNELEQQKQKEEQIKSNIKKGEKL